MCDLPKKYLAFGTLITLLVLPLTAIAQTDSEFSAQYTVAVKDTAAHFFHVTAKFSNVSQPKLDVALPIWTPGWYGHEYYAKNISRFVVTDEEGEPLAAPLSQVQTWTVDTEGKSEVIVEFDYFANILSLNQAQITDTFAFFTGTQLFLEPVGHRNATSEVRFVVPDEWPVISALQETSDPYVWTAPDYDTLVDSPTWLGAFNSVCFLVDGKPHFMVYEFGVSAEADTTQWSSQIQATTAVFGEAPYDKFIVFMLPSLKTNGWASGALEHSNSYVTCCGGGLHDINVHELFHLWNVKRIRPAELWPYDYSRSVDTPSLWVSEGFSVYYGSLIIHNVISNCVY